MRILKIASFLELIKTANFNQGENTQIFADKFPGLDKSAADRFYSIFGTWKNYDAYRELLKSFNDDAEVTHFIIKCEWKKQPQSLLLALYTHSLKLLNLGFSDQVFYRLLPFFIFLILHSA